MCDLRAPVSAAELFPEIPKNQERTTVKKQIDRCVQAQSFPQRAHSASTSDVQRAHLLPEPDSHCDGIAKSHCNGIARGATQETCVSYEADGTPIR